MADHEELLTLAFLWQLVDSGHWAELGFGERAVIFALLRHADKRGQAWPSILRIAAESGIHRISVQRALKRLVGHGLVVKKLIRVSARRSKNLFTLRMPETTPERQTRPEKQKRNPRGGFSAKQAALTSDTGGVDSKPSLTSKVDGQKCVAHTDLEEDIEEYGEKDKSGGRLPSPQVRSAPPPEEKIAVPKRGGVSSIVRNLSRSLSTPKKSGVASGESAFRDMRKNLGFPEDPQDE